MKLALVLAIALAGASVILVPTAAAEPCEVPGCNVAGAALCVAANAKNVSGWKQWLPDCLTQTA